MRITWKLCTFLSSPPFSHLVFTPLAVFLLHSHSPRWLAFSPCRLRPLHCIDFPVFSSVLAYCGTSRSSVRRSGQNTHALHRASPTIHAFFTTHDWRVKIAVKGLAALRRHTDVLHRCAEKSELDESTRSHNSFHLFFMLWDSLDSLSYSLVSIQARRACSSFGSCGVNSLCLVSQVNKRYSGPSIEQVSLRNVVCVCADSTSSSMVYPRLILDNDRHST
jgi:hypothetical protein